jgi:hypothetical protein
LAGLTLSAEVEADERAVRALGLLPPGEPPYPDGFEYSFDLPDGSVVTAPEQALPRELDPLLDEFANNAKPGPGPT